MVLAEKAFWKSFGKCKTKVYISDDGGVKLKAENVIVVESNLRRAYYNFSIELLKVMNFTEGEE